MDPSLKPDRRRKGSYYRRLEDVDRGLQIINSSAASAEMRFFINYLICEKVARGIVGIHGRPDSFGTRTPLPASVVYRYNFKLQLDEIKAATAGLDLNVVPQDLDWLFAAHNEQHLLQSPAPDFAKSARHLRNKLTHDFGPSNLAHVSKHAPFLNPKMETFQGCIPTMLNYLSAHFAGVA